MYANKNMAVDYDCIFVNNGMYRKIYYQQMIHSNQIIVIF